jgi:hypothetical protein
MRRNRIIAVLDILAAAALVMLLVFAFSSPSRGGGDAVARQIETVRR